MPIDFLQYCIERLVEFAPNLHESQIAAAGQHPPSSCRSSSTSTSIGFVHA
eukprot:NODE_31235_length_401_cov_0.948905.p6 GENE.NODE_31235_length_401_cov_0.948905~~NODE_31235_length_401_cov_0.948905.p6  ORF type:complete len:51 (-),score=8.53 NODE_31235_length_401_cov_0.948905:127-279(-)